MKKKVEKLVCDDIRKSAREAYSDKGKKWVTVVFIVLAILSALVYGIIRDQMWKNEQAAYRDFLQIHILDVGQGDCTLFRLPTGETMLIDCGPESSSSALSRYLFRQRIDTIDFVVFTHAHEDHIGNAEQVFDDYRVKQVLVPSLALKQESYSNLMNAINGEEGVKTNFAVPGNSYQLGLLSFTVLAPNSSSYEEENNESLVLRFTFGETSMLFTGDAEHDSENEILARYSSDFLDCDLLKVGHHGSNTSSSETFLDAVTPSVAIISCQKGNEYGHPHFEVLERLSERQIECLRTDQRGDILILSDGTTLTLP